MLDLKELPVWLAPQDPWWVLQEEGIENERAVEYIRFYNVNNFIPKLCHKNGLLQKPVGRVAFADNFVSCCCSLG